MARRLSVQLFLAMAMISPLENIHGIHYPADKGEIIITEQLAHADIFLKRPVLGTKAVIKTSFDKGTAKRLQVGIRRDPFWLSYDKYELTDMVTIPLTDKIRDRDGSVDLMFFAEGDDTPTWRLKSLEVSIEPAWPTWQEFKDYVRGVLTWERPL